MVFTFTQHSLIKLVVNIRCVMMIEEEFLVKAMYLSIIVSQM